MKDCPPAMNEEMSGLILNYLGLSPAGRTDLAFLERLVDAYTQAVPWESATRIARRVRLLDKDGSPDLNNFPRWPAEFWIDAIEHGAGGTCFESNYAFFKLLLALGYDGYLTINNMGESLACHSAIVVKLMGQNWLVDVGFPVYAPVLIRPTTVSRRQSAFHLYTITPAGAGRYQVERDRHPNKTCFTFIDSPVTDEAYRSITAADYGPEGLFLDRVLINKVVGDSVWRFNSAERPFKMERFQNGRKTDFYIKGHESGTDTLVSAVAERFKMQTGTIRLALAAVN